MLRSTSSMLTWTILYSCHLSHPEVSSDREEYAPMPALEIDNTSDNSSIVCLGEAAALVLHSLYEHLYFLAFAPALLHLHRRSP